MDVHMVSSDEKSAFDRDGYVLYRSLFDADEMSRLLDFARQDEALRASAYDRKDATGAATRLALWNTPGDDLYSMFSRSPRIVDRMELADGRTIGPTPRHDTSQHDERTR